MPLLKAKPTPIATIVLIAPSNIMLRALAIALLHIAVGTEAAEAI